MRDYKLIDLFNNYNFFLKLSLLSFSASIIVLNISLLIYDNKKSLIITLIIVFFLNFYNLKKYYKFNNNYSFFVYLLITKIITRIIEYQVFFYIFNIINSNNFSWIITTSFSHVLKFFLIEFYKMFQKKNLNKSMRKKSFKKNEN